MIYLVVDGFVSDNMSITIKTYPNNCTVSIIIRNDQTNKHEEHNIKLIGGIRSVALENRLESGDYIDITAECEGWKKSNFWTKAS